MGSCWACGRWFIGVHCVTASKYGDPGPVSIAQICDWMLIRCAGSVRKRWGINGREQVDGRGERWNLGAIPPRPGARKSQPFADRGGGRERHPPAKQPKGGSLPSTGGVSIWNSIHGRRTMGDLLQISLCRTIVPGHVTNQGPPQSLQHSLDSFSRPTWAMGWGITRAFV
jgi:hypothetical protein